MLARELQRVSGLLEGDVVDGVVGDVLADALLPVPLQVDDGAEAIEAGCGELEALELVGVDPQRHLSDLLVAAHGRLNLQTGLSRPTRRPPRRAQPLWRSLRKRLFWNRAPIESGEAQKRKAPPPARSPE